MPKHPGKNQGKYATRRSANSIEQPGEYANRRKTGRETPKNYDPEVNEPFSGGSTKVSQMYSQPSDE